MTLKMRHSSINQQLQVNRIWPREFRPEPIPLTIAEAALIHQALDEPGFENQEEEFAKAVAASTNNGVILSSTLASVILFRLIQLWNAPDIEYDTGVSMMLIATEILKRAYLPYIFLN